MTISRPRPLLLFAGSALVAIALAAAFVSTRRAPSISADTQPSVPADDSITCLGRISPDGHVMRISARSISGQPSLVSELFVKEGEHVKRGQVLAFLNSREQLEAGWRASEARMQIAQSRLAQVRAGVKPADISGQRAEIARLESELGHAESEFRRYQSLQQAAVVSTADYEAKKAEFDAKTQQLRQSRERLNSLSEVRDVDVALAEAELASATMSARVAKIKYEQAEIRSPIDGQIVEIHTRAGEEIKPAGILELAKVDPMYVVAEVSDRDIARVRVGQRASVSSEAIGVALSGTIERVGTKVAKNDVLNVDPTAMSDARVVETWIRLDSSEKAAGLIHGQVTVRITP